MVYWLSPNVIFNPEGIKKAEVAALPIPFDFTGLSFTWSDGVDGTRFVPYDSSFPAGGWADVWYTPRACADLGGGDHEIPLTVTISKAGASNSATTNLTVKCPP
jgi:hypothetical protein